MTAIEKSIIDLYCDYVYRANCIHITICKYEKNGNEMRAEKAALTQKQFYAAASEILNKILVNMDRSTVIEGIEKCNKHYKEYYDGTSNDVFRGVDIPDIIMFK